jgi:cobalt-zinc-cadmium efflux system membrane fusion protein
MGIRSYGVCLFLLAVLLAGCESKSEAERERESGVGQGSTTPPAKLSADGSIQLSPQQVQANAIQTVVARQETLSPAIAVVGRVQAQPGRESEVVAPFAGRLVTAGAPLPRVGDTVEQGQALAEVEQLLPASERNQYATQVTQLKAAATQAEQEVDLRRIELDRAKQLYDGGAIPLRQFQAAEFNLRQAESRLQSAQVSAAQYEALLSPEGAGPRRVPIVAPISGSVVTSSLTFGMQVDPAKSLMKIVDLSTVWVQAAVPEAELGPTRKASRAEVTSPAVPGRIFDAALVTVSPAVDLTSRTISVIYTVSNADGALRVDMTANVRIPTGPLKPALLIPASAVLYGAGQSLVYVERQPGIYQRRNVVTGETRGSELVVSSGLNPGEKVVSVGAETLRSETLRGDIPTDEGH